MGAGERKHKTSELLSLPKILVQQQVQAPVQAAGAQVSSAHIEAGVVSKALPAQATYLLSLELSQDMPSVSK